jgi:hypothetical protein
MGLSRTPVALQGEFARAHRQLQAREEASEQARTHAICGARFNACSKQQGCNDGDDDDGF